MVVGHRGPVMWRGRGRPPARPRIMMRPRSGHRGGYSDAVTPNAAPSWMSSVLKSDDDDDDFAQPVPVSTSTTLTRDRAEAQISVSPTSMRSGAEPYKCDPQGLSEGENAAIGQQGTSCGSGMSERGQTSTQPAPVEAHARRSGNL